MRMVEDYDKTGMLTTTIHRNMIMTSQCCFSPLSGAKLAKWRTFFFLQCIPDSPVRVQSNENRMNIEARCPGKLWICQVKVILIPIIMVEFEFPLCWENSSCHGVLFAESPQFLMTVDGIRQSSMIYYSRWWQSRKYIIYYYYILNLVAWRIIFRCSIITSRCILNTNRIEIIKDSDKISLAGFRRYLNLNQSAQYNVPNHCHIQV